MKTFQKYRIYILICLISVIVGSSAAIVWGKLNSNIITLPKEFYEVRTDINTKFPDLGITKYSSSETLVNYISNKKVLLLVISSSCGACKKEIELLKSVDLLKNKGIQVVIVGHEEMELVKEFLITNNIDTPIFDDRHSKLRDEFDLKVTPVNFLVDNGVLDRMWNGSPQSVEDLYAKLGITDY